MIDSVGILVAMREELWAIRKVVELDWTGPGDFLSGKLGPLRIQVALSGAGPERARQAAELLVKYGQPKMLLGAGLSGGLTDTVGVGDVVLSSGVQAPDRPSLAASLEMLEVYGDGLGYDQLGSLLTLPRVLTTPADKAEVAAQYPDSLAIDMETYSLAEVACRNQLPWLAWRVVSDGNRQALPLDFNEYLDPKGQADLRRIAWAAVRVWKVGAQLARFGAAVNPARHRLAQQVRRFLGVLAAW